MEGILFLLSLKERQKFSTEFVFFAETPLESVAIGRDRKVANNW